MDNKELVQKQFGANAAKYVTSKPHAKGESLQRLVTLIEPQSNWHVLDIATGAGHTALAFAPHVAQVTATDITLAMLEETAKLAKERGLGNVHTQYADAEALPFEANTFDLVTSRIAPHHFPDIAKFVGEAVRVLKPNSILAVVDNVVPEGTAGDYVNNFEKLRDPSHGRCLSLNEWLTCFTEAGLTVLHHECLDKIIEFEWWARRMTSDEAIIAQLRNLLLNAPDDVLPFLQPDEANNMMAFHLQEGLFIGHLM